MSPQSSGALLATSVDDSEVVRSSDRNDEKLAESNFIKPVRRAEQPIFLTPNVR